MTTETVQELRVEMQAVTRERDRLRAELAAQPALREIARLKAERDGLRDQLVLRNVHTTDQDLSDDQLREKFRKTPILNQTFSSPDAYVAAVRNPPRRA